MLWKTVRFKKYVSYNSSSHIQKKLSLVPGVQYLKWIYILSYPVIIETDYTISWKSSLDGK